MKKNLIITFFIIILTISLVTAVTISGQGSSYSFVVENCTSPDVNTTFDCNPASIRFECEAYNPAFINQVEFRIQGNDYTTTQNSTNPNQFYIYYNKPAEGSTNLNPIVLDRERITDTQNIKVNAYEYLAIQHNCTTCPANITRTELQPCQLDDTIIVEYTSSNETCIPSYNTTENCNYCSPNLIATYGICDENLTQTINYNDNNLSNCCLMTGLNSDCPTYYYPYNQTYTQSCDIYEQEIDCTADQQPVLNDKINIVCTMPDNQEYCCVINTYQGNNLLATSPEYKEATSSIFTLSGQQETRTCFTPDKALLNAYYTEKELRPDNNYKIEVLCTTTNGTKIIYQTPINPVYHSVDWLPYRLKWFGTSPITIIFTVIVLLGAVLLIIFFIKRARG
jgi:hypothetical protein